MVIEHYHQEIIPLLFRFINQVFQLKVLLKNHSFSYHIIVNTTDIVARKLWNILSNDSMMLKVININLQRYQQDNSLDL